MYGFFFSASSFQRLSSYDFLIMYLDGNDSVSAILEEVLCIESDDSSLIGLSHIREDGVDHADQHAILVWVTRVLHDRHDVRPLLRDVQQIAARAVRELHCIDDAVLQTICGDKIREG